MPESPRSIAGTELDFPPSVRPFLLFLAIAGGTTFCLGRILPPVAQAAEALKLEAFAERKDEWDALLVGSSYTAHGIDPGLFDERLAEHGVEVQSFNLGLPGGGLADAHAVLLRVEALRPRCLRWILVEAERISRVGDEGVSLTPKHIGTTDPKTAALLWTWIGDIEPRSHRRQPARWRTVLAAAYHTAGVGRALPWIEAAIGTGPTAVERQQILGSRLDGYASLEEHGLVGIASQPERYQRRQRAMQRRVLLLQERQDQHAPPLPSARPFYTRIEELGRRMGTQVVFYTIREGAHASDAAALWSQGEIGELIAFDDPKAFPELYDIDMTIDGGHLSRAGAVAFTGYLADAFAVLVKTRSP